ncbi:hypothetical protein DY000_02034065 [Brassica cretica]|uniref:DUF3741 domain-containing protein n=1 Tax=Brassica cretica TaxID=69181 RepID=A0ABQ7DL96_BRACR|nr:hypothetical protein DY000_02034065 [Brassica cretica]
MEVNGEEERISRREDEEKEGFLNSPCSAFHKTVQAILKCLGLESSSSISPSSSSSSSEDHGTEIVQETGFMAMVTRLSTKLLNFSKASANLFLSQSRGIYLILWNSRKIQPYPEMLHQSPVCLKTSRNSLLSTGPHLSMRENSNMVLVPEYKKAKEQHKNPNMRRRSDLNLAKNVIKVFDHPSIQGKTMYSSVNGGTNEGGTWRSIDSAANTDDPQSTTRKKKKQIPLSLKEVYEKLTVEKKSWKNQTKAPPDSTEQNHRWDSHGQQQRKH